MKLTEVKNVHKFHRLKYNCESSGFLQIYHTCSTVLRSSFKIFRYRQREKKFYQCCKFEEESLKEDGVADETSFTSEGQAILLSARF